MASSSLRVFLLFISLYTAGKSNSSIHWSLINTLIINRYHAVLSAGGFQFYGVSQCTFNSSELKDIEFTRSYYYNKQMCVHFSSTAGRFVGYSKFCIFQADYLNNQTTFINALKQQKERFCHSTINIFYPKILSKSGKFASLLKLRSHYWWSMIGWSLWIHLQLQLKHTVVAACWLNTVTACTSCYCGIDTFPLTNIPQIWGNSLDESVTICIIFCIYKDCITSSRCCF